MLENVISDPAAAMAMFGAAVLAGFTVTALRHRRRKMATREEQLRRSIYWRQR
jgi:hypothetical protein